jgi:hypothetical protein
MDHKIVAKLEDNVAPAIAEVIVRLSLKRLPLLPSKVTMHQMAKAAVAVYEAAVDNQRPEGEACRLPTQFSP